MKFFPAFFLGGSLAIFLSAGNANAAAPEGNNGNGNVQKYVVKFANNGEGRGSIQATEANNDCPKLSAAYRMACLNLSPQAAEALSRSPGIESVELDVEAHAAVLPREEV